MIKNETKIIDENKNLLINSMNGKGNNNREIYAEIQSDKFKTLFKKSDEKKNLLINNNTIQEDTLENQSSANKNSSEDVKININIHKSNKKNNIIPLNNSTYYTSKEKEVQSIELKKEKKFNFKPFFTSFTAKNNFKIFGSNPEVSSFSLLNKSNTPTNRDYILNKLNKDNIQNFIQTNKNKPFFGSMLFKNHSHKNLKNNNSNNINNEENNTKLLLKYAKEHKNNLSYDLDKNGKRLDNIMEKIKINKKEIEINKETEEEDKDINKNQNKIRTKNKIPYNQKIFKKIIEEVKDEKNYIQKVVHRRLMNNQKEYYRNSLINPNLKKYNTNTYNNEITTKKIRNPFNTSLNKETKDINRNYSTKRYSFIKSEVNEDNQLNVSYGNMINRFSNNLNDEIICKKKSSIKIKKIPLNKLKYKIQVNRQGNNNYFYTNENINLNSYNYYNGLNCNTHRIISNINNLTRFSESTFNNNNYSFTNNEQRASEIPKNNYSLYNIQNLNLENNEKDDKKQNILYNKVNLRKKPAKKIKINLNSNFYPSNKNISYEKNIMNNNILLYNNGNKIFKEKKMGLFKKKLPENSSDKQNFVNNNISYISTSNANKKSNLYNKKMNSTIFKSYITNNNKYMNSKMNESYINNYYINFNGRYNDANKTYNTNISNTINKINTNDSTVTYDSKYSNFHKLKSINYQNLRNDFFNNEYESNTNSSYNAKDEIKLEQIITLLNFEDLLIIEDKLNTVLNILKTDKNTSYEFFDLFNYFFSSPLKSKFEQIYKYLLNETEAMKIFINHSLILIIICYDFSLNNKNNSNIKFSLYESVRLIYINLLMVISPIKSKIKSENKDFYNLRLIEMSGISNIINKNLIKFNNNDNDEDISFNRELLHNNTNLLVKNISLIIKNYKNNTISELYYSIQTNSITLEEMNTFFRQNILKEDFIGCSILASTFLKEKENFALSPIPYIITPSPKKYSLVLDLDETLIHFKVNHSHNDEGILKLRPGVVTFLEVIKEYYEIILFTEASEAYTELIMEAFNKNEFFDYKFFRQHTIIIGQDFVKDLQRIGRPLDRIIIVDNIAQNFRMQKNNGILIKPFDGEDQNDQALIDLIPILINIAKDNIDARNGLVKYRDEIMTKITSNLFRRNNCDKVGI